MEGGSKDKVTMMDTVVKGIVMKKLTKKKENFILEYVQNGRNPIQAALAAGYSPEGVTEKAYALLDNPDIKARISRIYGRTIPSKVTKKALNELYFDAVGMAKRNNNPVALVNALKGLSVLNGLELNKHQVEGEMAFTLSNFIDKIRMKKLKREKKQTEKNK